MKFSVATAALITATNAFPHMAKMMQVDDAALEKRFTSTLQSFANFVPTGYKGQTGAYGYVAPKAGDFRGPCPGLNTAANHGYLPHNGVATFAQYVDAQMSLYNVGLDLAILLATIAVPLDGDIITTKMSIGGDATPLTANPLVLASGGKEGGLIVHNTFEADSSLTRNDVFPAKGDNYNFNGTLFKQMKDTCDKSSAGLYDRNCMTIYRKRRYDDSRATNPNFYFGIKSLLLFGASSFLYELMPTAGGQPDYNTIAAFFGAVPNGSGGFSDHAAGVGEHIPPNWFPRTTPYTIPLVGNEIFAQYAGAPVEFGGNAGLNNFNGESFGTQLASGKLNAQNAQDYQCLLFMIATENVPSAVGSVPVANADQLAFAKLAVTPARAASGCPAVTGQPVLG